ncbi:peptide/nickel transport system permease protein [Jatrophihabitans sp. GAS493]|uniref:ABC transporter permease n=1 Tax=Jatrophihabitans sp. GAS493 TaxID=1907575 RepID=UPI000BB68253|nr:ABC transporter permease [Jatrophihabitans sp. GAS493]SOD75123.1 peptide/nickel transport system permease protein [Jatrophihabitans sp. GAS493]
MSVPLESLESDVDFEGLIEVEGDGIVGRSPWQIAMSRLRHDTVTMIALGVVIFTIVLAVAAPFLNALGVTDPYTFHNELVGGLGSLPLGTWGGISLAHPFGVEPGTGRDVFSRVLTGVSLSLFIATLATLFSLVIGVVLGIISGYMGKATDFIIGRTMELVLCFPQTLMLLALSPVLKPRITQMGVPSGTATDVAYLIFVLGFFGWPYIARIIRGQVLSMRNREFVEASRSLGASRRRIWMKELVPNLWAPIIVFVSLTLPLNIAAEAALSFLGVGIQPPTPSLGSILNNSVSYYDADPAFFYIPGTVLVVIVLAFNLFGDGLRDALDPKSSR